MKILAIERELEGVSEEDFAPHLKAEARKIWELQQSGRLREIHFHRDKHVAVLVLECADEGEAQAILNELPLVQNGLIAFDLWPLTPYDGFARLFAN